MQKKRLFITTLLTVALTIGVARGAYAKMFGSVCSSRLGQDENGNCEVQYTETTYFLWIPFHSHYSIPCSTGISSLQGCG